MKGKILRVTVAGASGFVGKNLIKKLRKSHIVRGLSRSQRDSSDNVDWCKTDLFSFHSTQKALEGTDIAIYLVHSMLPSSKLFQGTFQDTDLLLADNFAKACVQNNVKQIIYLGGLSPEKGVSKHLESRKEVEGVLKSTGLPVTILRAGMVVGDGGSSFEILKNLVMNLPLMLLPNWTKSNTQAIDIDDLVNVLTAVINKQPFFNRTINVVNGEKITYEELIRQTSDFLGKNKNMIHVPINYTSFSKLWVKFFGETDYELVSPLIDSLLCDLPSPKTPTEIESLISHKTFKSMLQKISKNKKHTKKSKKKPNGNTVRSIQRLSNPQKLDEHQISNEYLNWLPNHMRHFIKAKKVGDNISFFIVGLKKPLLVLEQIDPNSSLDRVKFHISGCLLSRTTDSGWLEFRIISNGTYTLASINDFIPSLPWYLYRYTQAPLHNQVMKAFGKHLSSKRLLTLKA